MVKITKKSIVTINDRASSMLKIGKVTSKEAIVVSSNINELLEYWKPYINTITADSRKKFAQHKKVSEYLKYRLLFC